MKKSAFILLSAILLASCGSIETSSNTGRGEGPHTNKTSVVESVSNTKSETEQTSTATSESKSSSNVTSENVPSSEQTKTSESNDLPIDTKSSSSQQTTGGTIVTANFPTDKEAIDLSNNSAVFDQVKATFGKHLTNMTVSLVYADLGGIRLSSAKAGASWVLTFDIEVTSLSVFAKPYTKKHYDDSLYYVDAMSAAVNGETLINTEASTSAEDPNVAYGEYKLNLSTPAKVITITGTGGARPLLSSMALTLK